MIVKLYINYCMCVFANIAKELIHSVESMFIIDKSLNDISSIDILVTYDMGKIKIKYSDEEILCNEQEFGFYLVTAIENILVKKCNGLIYHGSAISYDNLYSIAFVGSSGSGKTTIVENLEKYSSKFKRISDDLLILNGTQLQKTFLPTKIQLKSNENCSIRKLIKPLTFDLYTNVEVFTLSMVVSVKFQLSNINMFTKLDTLSGVETLISNSRSAPNNLKLMKNITSIIRNVPIYSLKYHDNRYAVDCLLSALV